VLAAPAAGAQTVYGFATCNPQTGACDYCHLPGVCNMQVAQGSCSGSPASVSAPASPSVIANPTVYLVHWGSYWTSNASQAAGDVTVWKKIGTDWRFWQPLSEYSPGITYGSPSVIDFGSQTVPGANPWGTGTYVADWQVQAELKNELDAATLLPPDGHRIYVIVLPPGVSDDYGLTGYHGYLSYGSQSVPYAVIATASPNGFVISNPTFASATWRGIDTLISHEVYEATTDLLTQPFGWTNGACGTSTEIADICESFFSNPIDGYTVATFWSNKAGGCIGPVDLNTTDPGPPAYGCGWQCNTNTDTTISNCATLTCPDGQICGTNGLCHVHRTGCPPGTGDCGGYCCRCTGTSCS
jgi:hypothetical protein